MVCPKCRASVADDSNFCPRCGTPFGKRGGFVATLWRDNKPGFLSLSLVVVAVLALMAVAFETANEAARNAWLRWLTPWKPVERFTFAKIDPLPNQLVVPVSEPFTLPSAPD